MTSGVVYTPHGRVEHLDDNQWMLRLLYWGNGWYFMAQRPDDWFELVEPVGRRTIVETYRGTAVFGGGENDVLTRHLAPFDSLIMTLCWRDVRGVITVREWFTLEETT